MKKERTQSVRGKLEWSGRKKEGGTTGEGDELQRGVGWGGKKK